MASDIEYDEPTKLSLSQIDSILQIQSLKQLFILSGEYGTYTAIINTKLNKSGIYYLKVFDAKGNIELSPDRISKRTETRIKETGNNTLKINFTQYDGSWECFFVGRIELWFKPNSEVKGEKILEKNFKIDGWTR